MQGVGARCEVQGVRWKVWGERCEVQSTEDNIPNVVWVAGGRYGTWSSNKKIKKKFLEKWNKIISYFWKVTAQNKAGSFLMYFLSVFSSFAPACKNVERVPAGSWFISIYLCK